jgi:hypothetical protein
MADSNRLVLSPEWKIAFDERHIVAKEIAIRRQMDKVNADEGAAKMAHTLGLLQGQILMLEFLRETLPKRMQREVEEERNAAQVASSSPITVSPDIL